MELAIFLQEAISRNWVLSDKSVIFFRAQEYPIVFSCQFFSLLRKKNFFVESLDCNALALNDLFARLHMSFLGLASIFWLKELESCDAKKRQQIFQYLQSYGGPAQIIGFFTSESSLKETPSLLMVDIPEKIEGDTFEVLLAFFEKNVAQKNNLLKKIVFHQSSSVALDSACVLMHYGQVIGKDTQLFASQWLDRIIVSEKSLFTLSQAFFAKDKAAFMKQWQSISDNYNMPFWIVFWGEQLFRASYFIWYQEQKQFAQARKMGFRLPFSFLQRDWKKIHREELKNAHQFLYDLDFDLKNNAHERTNLDLFFSKFFLNQFTL